MTGITIYPLGSNGWIPSNTFETVSFAFFYQDELYVLDAGTGIARLLELQSSLFAHQWAKLKGVHIFLSHYHLDHVIGLFWARALFRGVPLTVYSPGQGVYGKSSLEMLTGIFGKPYSPKPLVDLVEGLKTIDLDPPGITMDDLEIKVKLNKEHSDPSVSIRFNDWFAYVTDTPPEDETIEFVRGVKVLLHESYFDSSAQFVNENDDLGVHRSGPHTGTFGAGLIAKRAGVEKLVLIHHNPEIQLRDVEEGALNVKERLNLDCKIARDLFGIEI